MSQKIEAPTGRIFSDRPISTDPENILWKEDIVSQQINEIAERIVEPLRRSTDAQDSLTLAVHGRWGSGKTSFIKMVLEAAKKQLETFDQQDRLIECWYSAVAHDGALLPTRATLARAILLAFAGGSLVGSNNDDRHDQAQVEAIRVFAQHIDREEAALMIDNPPSTVNPAERSEFISKKLARVSERLGNLVGFDAIIKAELQGRSVIDPGKQRVMVVVVDDLDRCSPQFVAEVLETIQQWSTVGNLFFLLAVDQDVLNDAISHRYGSHNIRASPQVALEKYVQHSVEIPELSDEKLRAYVRHLLDDEVKRGDIVARSLSDHVDILMHGIKVPTPRGIKRCLNTIRPPLAYALREMEKNHDGVKSGGDLPEKDVRLLIKERLLEYTWRKFYRDYYLRARGRQNQFTSALMALGNASLQFQQDEDREQLEFAFDRVRKRLNVSREDLETDPRLAQFLSLRPLFFGEAAGLGMPDLLAGITPADKPEEQSFNPAQLLERRSPVQQVENLARESREAQSRNDYEAVVNVGINAINLFNEMGAGAFTRAEVADFGNIALAIENVASATGIAEIQDISHRLYRASYELDPGHANNTLNYVSFILDARTPRLTEQYGYCADILDNQKELFENAHLARWYELRAQLALQINPGGNEWARYIEELVEVIERNERPRERPYERLTSFYSKAKASRLGTSLLKRAARAHVPRVSGQDQNYALLLYADYLDKDADQQTESSVMEALEVYRYVLRPEEEGGIVNTSAAPRRMNAFHNAAVSLVRAGYTAVAGDYWYNAYQLRHDISEQYFRNLARSYMHYLEEHCNRSDLAQIVSNSHELPEKPRPRDPGKPEPDEFVPGGIHALFDLAAHRDIK